MGEGQRNLSRLWTQQRVQHGARTHDPGNMTWAETKSQHVTECATQALCNYYHS